MDGAPSPIDYRTSEPISGPALAVLLDESWPDHAPLDPAVLEWHSAGWVCGYDGDRLVGFVNVAWDGARTSSCSTPPSRRPTGIAASAAAWSPPRSPCPGTAAAIGCTSTTTRS